MFGLHYVPTERMGHPLHPVANSEHRQSETKHAAVTVRRFFVIDRAGAAGQDNADRLQALDVGNGGIARQNRGEHFLFANPTRDQLRVLAAKIQNNHAAWHVHAESSLSSTPTWNLLAQDNVHQLTRNDDNFGDSTTMNQMLDPLIVQSSLFGFGIAQAVFDLNFSANATVDLNHDFELLLFCQVLAKLRPGNASKPARVADHFPKLFTNVRSDGREHQNEQFNEALGHFRSSILLERLLRLHFIVILHDERNGGIEMPADLEVVRNAFESLVRFAKEELFFR